MIKRAIIVISLVSLVLKEVNAYSQEHSCKARAIPGESVVCVCDSDYCDEIIRERPTSNHYVAYASSKGGLRFYKVKGTLQQAFQNTFPVTTLSLNVTKQYQTIEGFGGAITDAAGMNWKSLNHSKVRDYLIDSYFSPKGLEYNVVRTPIGGCDCSNRKYALNELPKYDKKLANFSLVYEDYEYKIPMFRAALKATNNKINVVASTWSPPDWMKISNDISVCGKLNPDYYQTYADYHIKFIEAYKREGIDIWGVTTTNEPANAFLSTMVFNCMGWSSSDQSTWIVNNLGPSIRASKFNNTMIFVNDDQRFYIPFFFNELVATNPDVLKYINGVAVHGYGDKIISPSMLASVTKPYPDLKLMVTEFCEGYLPLENHKVKLGSWDRAESYITSILGNLNYGAVGYIDWNLCLDKTGGPNWALNYIDSPIIVFPELMEFVKQPTYYAMGHFAKFIPRGSKRIDVDISKTAYDIGLQNVAFLTPDDTVVIILYNPSDETRVSINLGSRTAVPMVPANSLVTIEMVVDESSFEPSSWNVGPGFAAPENEQSAISKIQTSDADPEGRTSNGSNGSNPSPSSAQQTKKQATKPNTRSNTQKTNKGNTSQSQPKRPPTKNSKHQHRRQSSANSHTRARHGF